MSDILAVNIGSSSLKFALYPVTSGEHVQHAHVRGVFEGLEPGGQSRLHMHIQGVPSSLPVQVDHQTGVTAALTVLRQMVRSWLGDKPLVAVAHRIVHGGLKYRDAVVLTPAHLEALAAYNVLAPLHQPHNLAGAQAFMTAFPDTPQVGCFDTAFHQTVPELETRFALPAPWHEQGVRRYGFHGLSYDYVAGRLQRLSPRAQGRLLMAHLGNGSSLCAAVAGRSVATTMGFSALDGLMMGTRCGALDPGVLLYLLAQGWTAPRLETLLYKESGLLGVSGVSADMRTLRQSSDPLAVLATDLYVHRTRREAGALTAVMQGLDVLAFTGGIGEHDATTRAQICDGLRYLGVALSPSANQAADGHRAVPIHADGSAVEVWVMPTDEGRVAAEAALARVHAGRPFAHAQSRA